MVGTMPRHELVADNAMQNGMHDGPLRRGRLPAARGLFRRQFNRGGAADVHMQLTTFHEDAAPDHSPGLQTPLSVPPPRRKYIAGWRSLTALA